jgi:hypothetical protein
MTNEVRTAPPSGDANNTDVFMWAVYLLGGESKLVDVEDIYFKAFELAPLRLGWRTRPDIPNFKKTAKALQEIEAKSHLGLLQKMGPNYRRLTPAGVEWIESYKEVLGRIYTSSNTVQAPSNSEIMRQHREIRSSEVWGLWASGKKLNLSYLANVLNCSKASPLSIWQDRLADLNEVVRISKDIEMLKFAEEAKELIEGIK